MNLFAVKRKFELDPMRRNLLRYAGKVVDDLYYDLINEIPNHSFQFRLDGIKEPIESIVQRMTEQKLDILSRLEDNVKLSDFSLLTAITQAEVIMGDLKKEFQALENVRETRKMTITRILTNFFVHLEIFLNHTYDLWEGDEEILQALSQAFRNISQDLEIIKELVAVELRRDPSLRDSASKEVPEWEENLASLRKLRILDILRDCFQEKSVEGMFGEFQFPVSERLSYFEENFAPIRRKILLDSFLNNTLLRYDPRCSKKDVEDLE